MINAWNTGAKDLDFSENSKSKLILFFMLQLGVADYSDVEENRDLFIILTQK